MVIVPIVILACGNVYCGYVCPFGALQELVGDLRPPSLDTAPRKGSWRYGRAVKYVILLVVVAQVIAGREGAILAVDPLVAFFVLGGGLPLALAGAVLGLSFFFPRFWCRNLCPSGAFLSLLNGVRALRRLLPPTRPGMCDLGVRRPEELDCIMCDRCRRHRAATAGGATSGGTGVRRSEMTYLAAVALLATTFVVASFLHRAEATSAAESPAAAAKAGAPLERPRRSHRSRPLDVRKIRQLIRSGDLSGREAEYYSTVGEDAPAAGRAAPTP
jgi:hypothetical protein